MSMSYKIRQRAGFRAQVTRHIKTVEGFWIKKNNLSSNDLSDIMIVQGKLEKLESQLETLNEEIGSSLNDETEIDDEVDKSSEIRESLWDAILKIAQLLSPSASIEGDDKDDEFDKDDKDGRFEVGWPWKSNHPELPDNYDLSFGRLCSLHKRLTKDKDAMETYDSTIKQQLNMGIIEEVKETTTENLVHYLPHHCIIKPDRSTTKLRVVYDASSKAHNSLLSLNDCLLRGPVFLQDLCGLFLRFRTYPYAVISDIEKAFLQILIRPMDRDVTRFLWLKDKFGSVCEDNLVTYRFCTVLFGIISSPFLLDATIKYFLLENPSKLAKLISENLYVDNVIIGGETPAQCFDIYNESKQIFKVNGMNIREFQSNCADLMNAIPDEDKGKPMPKVLGMLWNPTQDTISCAPVKFLPVNVTTKRHLLQAVSQVFDPTGLFSPVVIQVKIIVQKLWKQKIKWDESLTELMLEEWSSVASDLQSICKVEIPRYMGLSSSGQWSLHCFCHASAKAYGAVLYLQSTNQGSIPNIVYSKTKLAPIKSVTLPRLELMAVVIGSRMSKFVINQPRLSINSVTVWTDSKCVLQWLNSEKVLSVFVGNRIRELRGNDYAYRYVPTSVNPADISSRGCSLLSLVESVLWWHGPKFLQEEHSFWPKSEVTDKVSTEEKTQTTLTLSVQETIKESESSNLHFDFARFSTLRKLVRAVTWVRRYVWVIKSRIKSRKSKEPMPKSKPYLTGTEICEAEFSLIKMVQKETFDQSGKDCVFYKNVKRQLGVYTDESGLLRCAGRLEHSEISTDAKFPMLLPKEHKFTELVILDAHVRFMHAGTLHTLSIVREKFWIPHGKSVVRSTIRRCLKCRRFEGGSFPMPPFGPLPWFRTTTSRPFAHVGVDYFGPLFVKMAENINKVWILLFTCATSRAIHLEVTIGLSTEQSLLALRRFIAQWGTPSTLISDNAKQFKLANTVIHSLWSEIVRKFKHKLAMTEFNGCLYQSILPGWEDSTNGWLDP